MTFNELELAIAIENAGRCGDTPKTERQRKDLAKRVMTEWVDIHGDSFFPFTIDQIVETDTRIRKNKSTRMKISVAREHGTKCFWRNRSVGPCCSDVELGHLVPNCKGGDLSLKNCVIECRSHNNQRRERTIEEYIASGLRTERK